MGGCRFYHWYPIHYSPAPNYCYLFRYSTSSLTDNIGYKLVTLFRSCEGGADEPQVAMVASGRHPGHYFLGRKSGEVSQL